MSEKMKQERKARKAGERTQKMVSFRADLDVIEILTKVQNKGRLINDLVRQWWRHDAVRPDDDAEPEESDIEEYFK